MLPLKTILRERNNWGRITQRHSKNQVRFDDSANEMKTYKVEEGHTMRPYRERNNLSPKEEETQTMKSGPAKRKRVMDLVLEESSPSLKRMRISEFDISKDGLNDDGRVGDGNSNVEEEAQTTSSGPRKRKRPMDLLLEEASPTTNAKRHCRRVGNELSTDDESAPTLEFHFDSEDDESNDDGRVGVDANNNVEEEEEEAQPMQTRRRKRKRAMDLLLEEASAFTKASLLGFGAGSTISSSGQRRSLRLAQQSQINLG